MTQLVADLLERASTAVAVRRAMEAKAGHRGYRTPADLAERLGGGLWWRAPHLDLLAEKIAACRYGPIRLIVEMPPRSGKSELGSHYTPVWFLHEFPTKRVLLTSYEAGIAAHWGRAARNTITTHPGDLRLELSPDSAAAAEWDLAYGGGGMKTAGVGGPITGSGGDLVIIDDPVKNAEEANSALQREKVWDWYQSTLFTRLEPGASIIVIMTRWHAADLAGRLIQEAAKGGEQWDVLRLPALAEPDDPLGRAEGEALWPARFDVNAFTAIRQTIGPYWWAALYQQRPQAEEGGILKLPWWRYYRVTLPQYNVIYQAWDTAFKEKEINDYSACVTMGEFDGRYYVLDVYRARLEFPELKRMARALAQKWHPAKLIVEDKASGQSLIQELQRGGGVPVIPQDLPGDKVERARGITGLMEAGLVYLPEDASWLADFLDETSSFPTSAHDDQVDAYVHCLTALYKAQGGARQSASLDPLGIGMRGRRDNPLGLDMSKARYQDRDRMPT